jgi:hypothetical protein
VPLAEQTGEKQTTQAPTAQQATGNQDACEPVIFTAAAKFLFFAAFVLILCLAPLAEQTREKQTTQAPTAQQAASNQDACEPVILTAAAEFLFFAAFVLIPFLAPFAEQTGKKQATQAPTAQQATGNQDACEPVILTAAAAEFLFFAAFVLILCLVPLVKEMGKKQTTQAATAQKAAGN